MEDHPNIRADTITSGTFSLAPDLSGRIHARGISPCNCHVRQHEVDDPVRAIWKLCVRNRKLKRIVWAQAAALAISVVAHVWRWV